MKDFSQYATEVYPAHQSSLTTASQCLKKFFFQETTKPVKKSPALLRGSVLHKAIAMFHTSRDDSDEIFDEIWKEEVHEESLVDWQEEVEEDYRKDTFIMFYQYVASDLNRKAKIILIETPFKLYLNGFHFEGTLDQVRVIDQYLVLIDFKSSPSINLDLIRKGFQFFLYLEALKNGEFEKDGLLIRVQKPITKSYIYKLHDHLPYKNSRGKYLSSGNGLNDERGPVLYEISPDPSVIEDIGSLIEIIRQERFPRSVGLYCLSCQFKPLCFQNGEPVFAGKADQHGLKGYECI